MTIDSTKYFCKRGAVSARLNLVDTLLSVEYCYVNPYSYGGDPINFIDPTGLFALDLAFVSIGWDSNKGWNFGFSTPFYSYTWNQNGSKTFTAGIDASINLGFFTFGGDIGYSYNTYSGHSVSTGGHICLGAEGNCAGIEAGGSLYWDPYGNYLGATAYGGAFAELTLGDYNAKVNAGYEIGLMGMEGRGLYAGANVGKDGASLYASWAENGGWNYGGGYRFEVLRSEIEYSNENIKLAADKVWTYDTDIERYGRRYVDVDVDILDFFAHTKEGNNSLICKGNGCSRETKTALDIEETAEMFEKEFDLSKYKAIRMFSCSYGGGGENSPAQRLANRLNMPIIAATDVITLTNTTKYSIRLFFLDINFGNKTKATIDNNGKWVTYTPSR